MKIVYSEKFLQHYNPYETSERLEAIKNYLDEHCKPSYALPKEIEEKDLLLVHSKQLLEQEKQLSEAEPIQLGDNFFQKNTFGIAMLSVGSALKAAELSLQEFAFSLARPPGHHASANNFGGFCYLNNIAFAVRCMQRKKDIGKAMIINFDMHHGNGTQDIFYNDESVFYFSTHQNPEYTYPFLGFSSENNSHIKNIILDEGTTDGQFLKLFERGLQECLQKFSPNIVGISAGFDIFYKDSSIGNRLAIKNPETFNSIGKIIRGKFSCPIFAVLEGGYYLPMLGENVYSFLKAFE